MPKLTGIFSTFSDLEQIPPEDIARWLNPNPGIAVIENYIGNKIIYPQTIPVTKVELNLELAILRELMKRHKNNFQSGKNLNLPEALEDRLPNLPQLTLALVDALLPKDVVGVSLGNKIIGSVIKPDCPWPGSKFSLQVDNRNYQFKKGSVTVIPCQNNKCSVHFRGQNAKLFGKVDLSFDISGGKLGHLVDGRGFR